MNWQDSFHSFYLGDHKVLHDDIKAKTRVYLNFIVLYWKPDLSLKRYAVLCQFMTNTYFIHRLQEPRTKPPMGLKRGVEQPCTGGFNRGGNRLNHF